MYVIGTAGHVDHGKSTLVERLTGIDPDRWAEEKAREMTIDLGFAWLPLAGLPEEVGVIDVPGHRDFIENMLAGVGGIDLALLIIAADEGVMPQTREHLAILDLLEIKNGVVVLTKTDLIDDPDWLELVELDVGEVLAGTFLANAPIVPVSARTGDGIETLKAAIATALQATEAQPDLGRPRLAVDRVFSIAGFGTIVTGTLLNGSLHLGDVVEIQPAGLTARIRGLQSHKTKLEVAAPGRRLAINLTGIGKEDVQRGDVVAAPKTVRGTILCDIRYRHLADADAPLKHNADVKLFVGAREVLARTRVLGTGQINPGETGWLQLALREPAALLRGDRLILRRPSPGATLGGGLVLDPHPGRKHRRYRPEVLARLKTLTEGTPADRLLQFLERQPALTANKIAAAANMDQDAVTAAIADLAAEGRIYEKGAFVIPAGRWHAWLQAVAATLSRYHVDYPLRLGMPREELRSRLGLPAALYNALLKEVLAAGQLTETETLVRLPAHEVVFSGEQAAKIERLLAQFIRAGVNSPSVKESQAIVGEQVFTALLDLGRLRQLNSDVVYASPTYENLITEIVAHLKENGTIDAAKVRDMFQTSRKYAIALLEHLDDRRITRRVENHRELARR